MKQARNTAGKETPWPRKKIIVWNDEQGEGRFEWVGGSGVGELERASAVCNLERGVKIAVERAANGRMVVGG